MQSNSETPLELLSSYVARYERRKATSEHDTHREKDSYLAFSAGEENYLIAMTQVFEVLAETPEMITLPFTPGWLCGLTSHRGEVYSVIDFNYFVAGKQVFAAQKQAAYLLLCDIGQGYILKVDSIAGIRSAQLSPLRSQRVWIDAYAQIDGRDWLRINLAHLVTDATFIQNIQ